MSENIIQEIMRVFLFFFHLESDTAVDTSIFWKTTFLFYLHTVQSGLMIVIFPALLQQPHT